MRIENRSTHVNTATVNKQLENSLTVPVASIQIYFEGAKFYPLQGGGRRSPSGRERGAAILGRGSESPSPPARESGGAVWGSCKLPRRGPGRSHPKFKIWCNLKPQVTTEMPYYVQVIIPGTTEGLKL